MLYVISNEKYYIYLDKLYSYFPDIKVYHLSVTDINDRIMQDRRGEYTFNIPPQHINKLPLNSNFKFILVIEFR